MTDTILGDNAAEALEGHTLPGGWHVVKKVVPELGASGGTFSINYFVEDDSGRKGFCKVLNYAWLLTYSGHDPAEAMADATSFYLFERDLARECVSLSRVVTALDDGTIMLTGYTMPTISYIIFEVADNDIRQLLDASDALDLSMRIRAVHHVATGLKQLHGRNVAHQDVKPSNVLVFPPDSSGARVSKLGDLGRATVIGRPMKHDNLTVAGDRTYGPPEGLYGEVPDGFGPRRLACDLYQLGSMICFIFAAAPMNAVLQTELHPPHLWGNWHGTYEEVLPYVRDAFGRALDRIAQATPLAIRPQVRRLIEDLCDPDPNQRGHFRTRQRRGSQYALERFITDLDRLSYDAALARTTD